MHLDNISCGLVRLPQKESTMQIRALFINGALHSIFIYSNIGERDKKTHFFKNGAGEAYLSHISNGKNTTAYSSHIRAYQFRDIPFFFNRTFLVSTPHSNHLLCTSDLIHHTSPQKLPCLYFSFFIFTEFF